MLDYAWIIETERQALQVTEGITLDRDPVVGDEAAAMRHTRRLVPHRWSYTKRGWMSYLIALRTSSSGKRVSSLAANSQRYSWRNQRSPMAMRSRARFSGRMRGHSVAGTLTRQPGPPSIQAR